MVDEWEWLIEGDGLEPGITGSTPIQLSLGQGVGMNLLVAISGLAAML